VIEVLIISVSNHNMMFWLLTKTTLAMGRGSVAIYLITLQDIVASFLSMHLIVQHIY